MKCQKCGYESPIVRHGGDISQNTSGEKGGFKRRGHVLLCPECGFENPLPGISGLAAPKE